MVSCEILDFRCIFVNEIAGSVLLAVVLLAIFYFMTASKLRLGFDATVVLAFPLIFILGLAITGFSTIYAFATVMVGLMLAWIFNKIIGNR